MANHLKHLIDADTCKITRVVNQIDCIGTLGNVDCRHMAKSLDTEEIKKSTFLQAFAIHVRVRISGILYDRSRPIPGIQVMSYLLFRYVAGSLP